GELTKPRTWSYGEWMSASVDRLRDPRQRQERATRIPDVAGGAPPGPRLPAGDRRRRGRRRRHRQGHHLPALEDPRGALHRRLRAGGAPSDRRAAAGAAPGSAGEPTAPP